MKMDDCKGGKRTSKTKEQYHQETSSPDNVAKGEVPELKASEKKAFTQFRGKVQDAILGNYLFGKMKREENMDVSEFNELCCKAKEDIKEISLWGIPLLPTKCHPGTDVILLKFLQAKDYKVHEAFHMLQKMLKWRRDFRTDGIRNEIFSPDLQNVAYFDSTDREGHLLCYMLYGAFKDKELFLRTFGTQEKCIEFQRWRVQIMEEGMHGLGLGKGGSDAMVEIIDLKNSPSPATRDLRLTCRKALSLFEENYPDFIVKHIFVNVPLWYYAYHAVFSQFASQRTKSKFIFARPSKVPKTLLKYVSPENLPAQYGGFKRDNDTEFTAEDKVSELIVKGGDTQHIKIPVSEPGVTVVWDIIVIGPDVTYKEEFVPNDEGSYRILLQKEKKMMTSIRNSFYINEPGMILLTIANGTFKRKRILYRIKIKATIPVYIYLK